MVAKVIKVAEFIARPLEKQVSFAEIPYSIWDTISFSGGVVEAKAKPKVAHSGGWF
jgi:hypothetical protein